MSYRGDYRAGDTIDFKFATVSTAAVPTTLAGGGALSVYKSNSATESTAGVTLSIDFDGRTGMHHVRITTGTDGTFYADANDFDVVITTGTVGGVSVVGLIVGSFSIANRSAVRPTTAARTLDVSAAGNAGIDWSNVEAPTTALNLSGTNIDVDQIVASVSGAVGSVTGAVGSVTGAVGSVSGNVGGNVNGSVASVAGNVVGSVGSVVGAVGSVTGAVGSVTGNVGGNVNGSVASVAGNVAGSVGSVVGAVGSVTGAVGSVTGSVGSVLAAVTIAASQLFIKKGVGITITFPMTDSTLHAPALGLAVTSQRSIDGGGLAATTNAVTEVGGGLYSIVLSAADTNGAQITYIFSAALADTKYLMIVTQT